MKATAVAGSNIAFVKYWGQVDAELRLPANGSISMTLDRAVTMTTVEFCPDLAADSLELNGRPASLATTQRASSHLDHVRKIAGLDSRARVESRNSFPTGAGIASSASGFAALTLSASAAAGQSLSEEELSRLARLGSGSAARSIAGGFVEWLAGTRHENSFAHQLAPPEHWDLRDIVAVISVEHKGVGSEAGHALAPSSPFYACRRAEAEAALDRCRDAILARDFAALGDVAEADALSLHAVAMTSSPAILYWNPGTVAVIEAVRAWRREGIPVYFTIDAGPNVHVLTTRDAALVVGARLRRLPEVLDTISCAPGMGARLVDTHLF